MKFLNIEDNKALKFTLIFLPLFIIFSRFLADFYISCLALFFLTHCVYFKKLELKNTFVIILLIFYLYLLVNSFFSFDIKISLTKSIPYFRFIFFSLVLTLIFLKNLDATNLLLKSFLVSHTILFLDSTLQFYTGQNIYGSEILNGRVSSFFDDELVLGSYVAKCLPIILSLIILNKDKYSVKYEYYFIIISLIMSFYSSQRVGFFSCVLISIFYFSISVSYKKIFIFILIVVGGFYSASHLNSKNYDRLFVHTFEQFKSSTNYIWPSFRHELHAATAISMFKDRIILGQGLYAFRYLCSDPKFVPKKLLKENNYFYSPDEGIFLKENNSYYLIYSNGEKKELSHKGFYFYENSNKIGLKVKKGEKLFSNYEYPNGCNTHPHNFHIQFLAELGIVGYLFLFIFFFYLLIEISKFIFKGFVNKNYFSDMKKGYLISIFGLFLHLFPLIPSGNFFNNWISIIFYTNIALFLLYKKKAAL